MILRVAFVATLGLLLAGLVAAMPVLWAPSMLALVVEAAAMVSQ